MSEEEVTHLYLSMMYNVGNMPYLKLSESNDRTVTHDPSVCFHEALKISINGPSIKRGEGYHTIILTMGETETLYQFLKRLFGDYPGARYRIEGDTVYNK